MSEELGANITLVGFSDLDSATKDVVYKMVSHWVDKETSVRWGFQSLRITLKEVHKREKSELYEVHGHLLERGRKFHSEITDRNLFFALEEVLKKIKNEVEHSRKD